LVNKTAFSDKGRGKAKTFPDLNYYGEIVNGNPMRTGPVSGRCFPPLSNFPLLGKPLRKVF